MSLTISLRDRTGRPLPLGLTTILGLGALWTPLTLLFTVLAPLNIGSYEINGRSVTGPEFIAAGGLLALWLVGAVLAVAAYGLWQRRAWARRFLFALVVALNLASLVFGWSEGGASWVAAVASLLVSIPATYWYLFKKQAVVRYWTHDPVPEGPYDAA